MRTRGRVPGTYGQRGVERDRFGLRCEASDPAAPVLLPPHDEPATARVEVDAHQAASSGSVGARMEARSASICHRALPEKLTPPRRSDPLTTKARRMQGFRRCAEEDSNLHPVIPDQALNLVTRVSDTSYTSRSSRTSTNLDGMDAMDDLDVATDVATRFVGDDGLLGSGSNTSSARHQPRGRASTAAYRALPSSATPACPT